MGLHFILGTPREVGLTFTPIVQVRKPRLRPIHQLTQAYSMWLECLPRLSGSGAHTLNHSTLLRDNCINESCSTFLDIVFTFQQGAFWRWCLSSGDRVHRWDFVFHQRLVGKGSGHTRVCGALQITVAKSNCRDRQFSDGLTHGTCLGSLRKHCLVPTPESDVMGPRAWLRKPEKLPRGLSLAAG